MKKNTTDEHHQISAVWGVILMVAITVAIAATVYVHVSGMIGGTATRQQYLEIQVTPEGYPEIYNNWNILVWKVSNNTHTLGDNITIKIDIYDTREIDNKTTYELLTDSNGHCTFEYREEIIHKFTASFPGYKEDSFSPKIKYLSPDNIGHIITLFNPLSIIASLVLFSTFLAFKIENSRMKKKIYKLKNYLIGAYLLMIFVLLTLLIIGNYFIIGLNGSLTAFGYPESINLNTLDILFNLTIISIIIIIILLVINIIIKLVTQTAKSER